jgi:hypothetical protein
VSRPRCESGGRACGRRESTRPGDRTPLRAALSALGIAIGSAAIVGVLGLSASSQAGLLAEIDRLGTNMLTVEAGQSLTGAAAKLPEKRRRGSPSSTTSNSWHTPR